MHVFTRPKPSPLSKEQPSVSLVEALPGSRDASSPPLTSSLNSRHSAASAEESAYLRRASLLRWARLASTAMVVAVSATIVGLSSHVLRSYNESVMSGAWNLSLWPLDVDTRPTLAVLIAAGIATLGSLFYLAFAGIPTPRSRVLTQNYIFTTVSLGGAIASVVAIAYSFSIERDLRNYGGDSIHSWTCTLYQGANDFAAESSQLEIPVFTDSFVPTNFHRMCVETNVARWLLVGLLALQGFSTVVAILGVAADKRIGRIRRAQFIEKSSFT